MEITSLFVFALRYATGRCGTDPTQFAEILEIDTDVGYAYHLLLVIDKFRMRECRIRVVFWANMLNCGILCKASISKLCCFCPTPHIVTVLTKYIKVKTQNVKLSLQHSKESC